jgi:hypothetical protein
LLLVLLLTALIHPTPHHTTAMTIPGTTTSGMPFGFGSSTGPSDNLLIGLTCLAIFSLFYAFFVVRPRTKGGPHAPPVVTSSPVSSLPVVGTIVEFGKSPVKMVQRCYEDYGPVFTVPVSLALVISYAQK